MKKNVTAVYFSPTGNTKKSLTAMAQAIGERTETIDLTVHTAEKQFDDRDFVLLGAPVYGGRIPAAAKERFASILGNATPCIIAVTYGNRHYEDALLELMDMAEAQGFVVKGGAALIGRHTYGEIQITRPDSKDLKAAAVFAVQAAGNWREKSLCIPGNRPYKDGGGGGKFRPLTSESCVKCGLCAANCPMGAIGGDCQTVKDSCIACFRCIRDCPLGAKNMDTEEYRAFAASFTKRLEERRENEFFL